MAPYDSLRDYAAALEARGKLIRITEIDQDQYEMTAFYYRLIDRLRAKAPGFLVERTKVNGRWCETPVIGNVYNGFDTIAQCFGVEQLSDEQAQMYAAAVKKITSYQEKEGRWAAIQPKVVDRTAAPCKEVILQGEDADLLRFPWIKNNPADVGQYISSGSVIMQDPELGRNVGTYRMQVKGPRKTGIYFTNQSHGYKFMMRAADRGEERVKVSVASGIDPISWMMSSTRLADVGEDEFALAGGFRGRPVELVKSETNDLYVPAHAEFVIEGEISMDAEKEGPYGEMLGYIGKEVYTFWMDVKAITHRRNPWVLNMWPGISGNYMTLPWDVAHIIRLKKIMPNLVNLYTPIETASVVIISIDKRLPGEGIEAGLLILGYRMVGFSKKMVIVVDKDVDITDLSRVVQVVGTRWQPVPASVLVDHSFHIPIDPSSREMFLSSKIVIDATRQLPGEGGPETYPKDNRTVMEEEAAAAFKLVEQKWPTYFGTGR
jgi:4-hydroxy-3-polyprenylbenzoate decarboxylase